MSAKEMAERTETLIWWILNELPHVKVHTMDILARESDNGKFNSIVRNMAGRFRRVETGRQRHIETWRMFVVENRMFGWGKRKNAEPAEGDPAQRFR